MAKYNLKDYTNYIGNVFSELTILSIGDPIGGKMPKVTLLKSIIKKVGKHAIKVTNLPQTTHWE